MAPPGLQAEEKEEIKATQLIQKISYLSQNLLPSVPEATTDDKIYLVFTRIEDSEDDPYLPFNRKFDAVFAQDTRNAETGKLEHIRCGRNGMDLVVKFLSSLDLVSLPLDRMNQKLENLLKDLIELV
jgi:hypothetical protein